MDLETALLLLSVKADHVCVSNIHNKEFVEQQFQNVDPNDSSSFHTWNQTSIGNAAFIALNFDGESIKQKAIKLLVNYAQWHRANQK